MPKRKAKQTEVSDNKRRYKNVPRFSRLQRTTKIIVVVITFEIWQFEAISR